MMNVELTYFEREGLIVFIVFNFSKHYCSSMSSFSPMN